MINSNPIEINKSSLVSLRAEILRKQQEINANRPQERPRTQNSTKPKKKLTDKHKEIIDKAQDKEENEELLSRSRQMLESKTSLYNSLSKGGANLTERDLEISKRCLVQFDKKSPTYDHTDEYDSDDYDPAQNPDEEWVEYVDFLGRTRKCLRKDLEYMKRKDRELNNDRKSPVEAPKFVKEPVISKHVSSDQEKEASGELTEENELLSSDMRRELLRREWEQQEEELLNKKNVHYQDVLFNEARFHGVGYYAFSKDEEERIKQQENLKKLREETSKQQQATTELKKLREKQLAARLKAARNRKRARMGLPPESDEPEVPSEKPNQEDLEAKRKEAEKEEEESRKQAERSKIVRPWDIGKEILKTHYEYSQDEWVSKKRDQRYKEFAPPSSYSNLKPKRNISNEDDVIQDKTLYFTSKKSKFNEYLSSNNSTMASGSNNNRENTHKNFVDDSKKLEESVMAGLKFLREQSENRHMSDDEY